MRLWPAGPSVVAVGLLLGCSDTTGIDVPGPPEWVSVGVGAAHACALATDGAAWCWGANEHGQLGNLSLTASLVPVRVVAPRRIVELSTAGNHSCALFDDQAIHCWGENGMGQVGNGGPFDQLLPVRVEAGVRFAGVAVGVYYSCGRASSGEIHCWGGDRYSSTLGYATDDECPVPRIPVFWPCSLSPSQSVEASRFTALSAGLYHTCGLRTGGEAFCWGADHLGQMGTEATADLCPDPNTPPSDGTLCSTSPLAVAGNLRFASISAGAIHTCGLTADGRAWCWGADPLSFGQLGTEQPSTSVPAPVQGGIVFETIEASRENHIFGNTCGIAAGGEAYCWGANHGGQLGAEGPDPCAGDSPCAFAPLKVDTDLRFVSISPGIDFTCGLATDGELYCWGDNAAGQLGDGGLEAHNRPRRVRRPITI